ncbi:MAG TPA: cytochrome c3 family protein [Polyangiaceae bacterium]
MTEHASRWSWALLGIVLLVAALVAACETPEPPRFPHQSHLTKSDCGGASQAECLSCTTCHAPSERDRAHMLPDERLCAKCHRDDAHEIRHVVRPPPERPYGTIAFNHLKHLKMSGIRGQCVSCHAGVVDASEPRVPPMAQCFSCHEHEQQWKRGQCTPCHEPREVRKILPETFLRHDRGFSRRHGVLAMQEKALCQSCHTQAQCDDCHDVTQDLTIERRRPERIERQFVHRADFVTRHAMEAQAQPRRCASCHTPESCEACHAARGVSANRFDARNPHPPGWIGADARARSFHGIEARRDILVCATCHDQGPATNCIRCHKVGAYGGNPHPRGFKTTRTPSEQMCGYCHG